LRERLKRLHLTHIRHGHGVIRAANQGMHLPR
jgi:hypothetical protein